MSDEIFQFLTEKVPPEWFTAPPTVHTDAAEILCIGDLPGEASVPEFRATSRQARVEIAEQAAARFGRTLSWGVRHRDATTFFTTQRLPVMTRLPLAERAVLDTLVDAGVARSRSEALGWCVRLVGRHEAEWLGELREALVGVTHVRSEGPVSL
jgi:hypothetical protein